MSIHMLDVYIDSILSRSNVKGGVSVLHMIVFGLFRSVCFCSSCTGFSDCMLDVKNHVISQCNLFK